MTFDGALYTGLSASDFVEFDGLLWGFPWVFNNRFLLLCPA